MMRDIPLVLQQDAMDCGPACLAMVVGHYRKPVNREYLRVACALGKEGVSLLGISKAAETIGLRTIGGRLSFESLASEILLPCIIHWDQNHFVVLYNIKTHHKNEYTIDVADPSKGFVTYTKEKFCEHWISTKNNGEEKGNALLLEPTEQFYAQADTEKTSTQNRAKFLWSYLKETFARQQGRL